MSLKKKGTPEKMKIIAKEADLDNWKKQINASISGDGPFADKLSIKVKNKKKKNS